MTGLTYGTYVTQIATMAVVPTTDPNFQIIIPSMIDYAELRMQRDIDFLNTSTAINFTGTAGTSNLQLTSGYPFVVLENIGVTNPTTGFLEQLTPVTKEYLYAIYPTGSTQNVPQYFAPFNDNLVLLGPIPDQAYNYTVVGTQRFPTLGALPSIVSASTGGLIVFSSAHGLTTGNSITLSGFSPTTWNNTFVVTVVNPTSITVSTTATNAITIGTAVNNSSTTFISEYLPDVFIMASMIYISAYQRNFGKLNDDPQMAITYESQYQALLKGAMVEEARKKFESSAWTSQSPTPVATPTR